jgi:hypothetical protein
VLWNASIDSAQVANLSSEKYAPREKNFALFAAPIQWLQLQPSRRGVNSPPEQTPSALITNCRSNVTY